MYSFRPRPTRGIANSRPFPQTRTADITFFREKLADDFDRALEEDMERVGLVLIIGTFLKVPPVAKAPGEEVWPLEVCHT